jgi:hypothetical protein
MPIERTDLVAYITNEFGDIITESGVAPDDTVAGYGPGIDQALQVLGVPLAGPVDDADRVVIYALVAYFVLLRVVRRLTPRTDVSANSPTVTRSRSQQYNQAAAELDRATVHITALGYGYIAESGTAWEYGRLTTDWLEPRDLLGVDYRY